MATGDPAGAANETAITAVLDDLLAGGRREVRALFDNARLAEPEILVSPTPEQMGHRVFGFLIEHWRRIGGADGVPLAVDLDPLDLRPALGYLTLLDVLDQGHDFRYRLYGSEVVTHTGFDLTGKRFSEISDADIDSGAIPIFFMAIYRYILATGRPVFTVHQPRETVTKYHWHRLALPLANQQGEIVRILNCVRPSDIESSRFDQPLRGSRM